MDYLGTCWPWPGRGSDDPVGVWHDPCQMGRLRAWGVSFAMGILTGVPALLLAAFLLPAVAFSGLGAVVGVTLVIEVLELAVGELMLVLMVGGRTGGAVLTAFGGLLIAPPLALWLSSRLIDGFQISGFVGYVGTWALLLAASSIFGRIRPARLNGPLHPLQTKLQRQHEAAPPPVERT